jgi:hypothetical protein
MRRTGSPPPGTAPRSPGTGRRPGFDGGTTSSGAPTACWPARAGHPRGDPDRRRPGASRRQARRPHRREMRGGSRPASELSPHVRPTDKHPIAHTDRRYALDVGRLAVRSVDPTARPAGGRIDRASPASMARWDRRRLGGGTGLVFPESGDYVVALATSPVRIDRAADSAHTDENVWIVTTSLDAHDVKGGVKSPAGGRACVPPIEGPVMGDGPRVLVAYERNGSTAEIAQAIADGLFARSATDLLPASASRRRPHDAVLVARASTCSAGMRRSPCTHERARPATSGSSGGPLDDLPENRDRPLSVPSRRSPTGSGSRARHLRRPTRAGRRARSRPLTRWVGSRGPPQWPRIGAWADGRDDIARRTTPVLVLPERRCRRGAGAKRREVTAVSPGTTEGAGAFIRRS